MFKVPNPFNLGDQTTQPVGSLKADAEELIMVEGVDVGLVQQLIAKSQEPQILVATPADAAKRFTDERAFVQWYGQGRLVHLLVNNKGDLAGIMWYGCRVCPLTMDNPPTVTFAIRLYEGYTGRGLARPFMLKSLMRLVASGHLDKDYNGLWLATSLSNEAGLHNYSKFGYKEIARGSEKVIMVLSPQQIDAICQTT